MASQNKILVSLVIFFMICLTLIFYAQQWVTQEMEANTKVNIPVEVVNKTQPTTAQTSNIKNHQMESIKTSDNIQIDSQAKESVSSGSENKNNQIIHEIPLDSVILLQ